MNRERGRVNTRIKGLERLGAGYCENTGNGEGRKGLSLSLGHRKPIHSSAKDCPEARRQQM